MSTDDLRARVLRQLPAIVLRVPRKDLEECVDRAIDLVWNEAIEAGCIHLNHEGLCFAADKLHALRKPEERG